MYTYIRSIYIHIYKFILHREYTSYILWHFYRLIRLFVHLFVYLCYDEYTLYAHADVDIDTYVERVCVFVLHPGTTYKH